MIKNREKCKEEMIQLELTQALVESSLKNHYFPVCKTSNHLANFEYTIPENLKLRLNQTKFIHDYQLIASDT